MIHPNISEVAQKTIDRLAGRDLKEIARIKRMHAYGRWTSLADFLDTNPNKRQLMKKFHQLLNEGSYHTETNAYANKEAMELVLDERGWK